MFGTTRDLSSFECLLESHVDTADQELPAAPFKERAGSDSDAVLMEAIGQSLRSTGYPALRNLGISVIGGDVVLTGRVPTYHQKQLAQATVQQFLQVRGIANSIEVISCR
ncbi:MAG: BON domain-containing protein [Deltaproteobacteria bacterium]